MGKVHTLTKVLAAVRAAKKRGKTVVATNGCFDIVHVGHVRNLSNAKALGDVLVVGINSDASVRRNKGPSRPLVPQRERAEVLAALASVDYVFIFGEKTPFDWIKKLRPHIHVKGGGADVKKHPAFPAQKAAVKAAGGRLVLVPHVAGNSSSHIIRKMIR
ncbi:hypothetical protein EXS62_02960, partial [Candidatus Kaiserbacteria bacterium]|nr:hypothetical protein [Candidatus Kaiserbacteria bacterium]